MDNEVTQVTIGNLMKWRYETNAISTEEFIGFIFSVAGNLLPPVGTIIVLDDLTPKLPEEVVTSLHKWILENLI